MTLLETLGPTLAKGIFNLWTKDSDLIQNLSSDLIDLIAAKTSDTNAQRKGERRLLNS